MKPQRFTKQLFELAVQLAESAEVDGILILLDGVTDWQKLVEAAGRMKVVVAADLPDEVAGAKEAGLNPIVLNMPTAPVSEKLTQALLEAVADDLLRPGANVVAVYSGFEAGVLDSMSYLTLDEHLSRLTARDLQQLETSVPLDTLKTVVDLAVDIGREGREGKPVGTMFVVGDTRRVLAQCHDAGFDPVKGYKRKDRNLHDAKTREAVKEIAQLDGAFVVAPDGIVERSCQLIDSAHADLTLSKGLGSRHWAGAAISKNSSAIAVVVSQSTGTVRLFQNGEVMLRIEPLRRAMTWTDFDADPPSPD